MLQQLKEEARREFDEITNNNSIYTYCFECGKFGCNIKGNIECGNCLSNETIEYYSKKDVLDFIDSLITNEIKEETSFKSIMDETEKMIYKKCADFEKEMYNRKILVIKRGNIDEKLLIKEIKQDSSEIIIYV